MTQPVRLQLSRAKGFNLQVLSQATNGLPAVNCARPSKWGNPYRVVWGITETAEEAVTAFRAAVEAGGFDDFAPLRGKNLACWCGPDEACHVDVLLDLANGPVCGEVQP